MGSLEAAQSRVLAARRKGIVCPCCGLYAKEYARKLNSGMAAVLCWLVRRVGNSSAFVRVNAEAPRWVLRATRDWTQVRHWGLIEEQPLPPSKKKKKRTRTSGYWRPTRVGVAFARGRLPLPSHVVTYGDQRLRFEGRAVRIRECLGSRFDYDELMRS